MLKRQRGRDRRRDDDDQARLGVQRADIVTVRCPHSAEQIFGADEQVPRRGPSDNTLPAALGAIAYQNKAKLYGLLFTAAAETLTTIAGDPKHLGADIGVTAMLHTWGQNLQHHPHVHCMRVLSRLD